MNPQHRPSPGRPPLWATIFTLLSMLALFALGAWQIQRLHWKESLLAEIDAAYQTDAAKNLIGSEQLLNAFHEKRLILRGTVIGHYLDKKSFKLGPRVLDGRQGFDVYTPLKMLDGGIILVNRGWIPQDSYMPVPPEGTLRITGLMHEPDAANKFTPPNRPADEEWYSIDLRQIATVKALPDLAPYVLYTEGPRTDALPIPVGERPQLYNMHRAYAIFWFTMAGVLAVVYWLRFLRKA